MGIVPGLPRDADSSAFDIYGDNRKKVQNPTCQILIPWRCRHTAQYQMTLSVYKPGTIIQIGHHILTCNVILLFLVDDRLLSGIVFGVLPVVLKQQPYPFLLWDLRQGINGRGSHTEHEVHRLTTSLKLGSSYQL